MSASSRSVAVTCPSLAWSSLCVDVRNDVESNSSRGGAGSSSKHILSDVHGHVNAGEVMAVLGPSGSGKSSMLNVLAGRMAPSSSMHLRGHVAVDGQPVNPIKFRKNMAYVMQDDALDPTATPREALTFSAKLRLGKDAAATEKAVEDTLADLGITECADTLIGGERIKGISGGERKRTSVGVEMVTEPRLLFLDEPTSGLDSYSAYNTVAQLKQLAQEKGATVVCTIHQPSSEVFALFDRVLILKAGRVVYADTVAGMNDWFASRGFPIPPNYNPADHAMFVVQKTTVKGLEAANMYQPPPSTASTLADTVGMSSERAEQEVLPPTQSTFTEQLSWLLHREMKRVVRDKPALIGRFGVTIFLNTLFGLLFYGAGSGDDSDPQTFQDHFGALVMVAISSMFGAAQPALLAFPVERPIFLREYSAGTYSSIAYFFSKLSVELPMSFTQTLVAWTVMYWMIGFQGNFIFLVLSSFGLGVAATSVAICIGCVTPDVKQAMEATPMVFVPQMLFAGFFVRTDQIPIFLRWAQYLCSLKYSLNLLVLAEFTPGNCEKDGPKSAKACRQLKDSLTLKNDDCWVHILILSSLFLSFRIMGAFILGRKARSVY